MQQEIGQVALGIAWRLARPRRQHAAGGVSGEHRSWGMLWATPRKWLLRGDRPFSEDVLSSAVREPPHRRAALDAVHVGDLRPGVRPEQIVQPLQRGLGSPHGDAPAARGNTWLH